MLAHHPASRRTLADVTTELKKILDDAGLSLTAAQSEFAQLTYMERDTDPPPAPPAPTTSRKRLPGNPHVPTDLVGQVAENLRAGSTPAEQRYDRDQHPVPARRARIVGPRGRSGWSAAAPRPSTTDSRSARPACRNWSGTKTRCSSPTGDQGARTPGSGEDHPRPRRDTTVRYVPAVPEATLRRTPLPQSERRLALPDRFLLDPLTYQQRPAELALKGLRPRILLADVVGLGKTLEIGLILAELTRRGRGDRILVVTPQQVLEQFQQELWTRFAIPLIRLDSVGIQRIQREIPAGRNPFTFYKRIIISIDTLKGDAYRHHLDNMQWDAVVIDESHNLIGESSFRNKLARRLAPRTDALLLASATPHNGDAESFAELISMLDPAAIADKHRYEPKDIEHLYIRRTKISPEVTNEIGGKWRERGPSQAVYCPATPEEERVFGELTATWLGNHAPGVTSERRLFPYTLLKAFLSSHKALAKTAENRLKNATDEPERRALATLKQLAEQITDMDSAKLASLVAKLGEIGVGPGSPVRAVVFSESVPTLKWLHEVLPKRLGLTKPGQVDIMHGGFSDIEQERIVERFCLEDEPVRVLLTGDVASEGVNMHRACHHLIHYDLPWSLIRIEQRNGRIDRYGQEHQPEFAALILTSQTDGAKDDTTVAEKLLHREEQAHHSLGTAEGITREFTARKKRIAWSRTSSPGRPWISRSTRRTPSMTSSPTCSPGSATSQPPPSRRAPTCRNCSPRPRRSPVRPWTSPAPRCRSTTTVRCSPLSRRTIWCSGSRSCRRTT